MPSVPAGPSGARDRGKDLEVALGSGKVPWSQRAYIDQRESQSQHSEGEVTASQRGHSGGG